MAINQAIIRPDPGGSFLSAFQTVDSSMRDQQRLAMQAREMEARAIQQARENKATDFKLMMAAINRTDDLQQRGIDNGLRREDLALRREQLGQQNALQQFNADTSRYSANTARYNAFNPRGARSARSGDPLGLVPGTSSGSASASAAPRLPGPLPGDPGSIGGTAGGELQVGDYLPSDLSLVNNGILPGDPVASSETLVDTAAPTDANAPALLFPDEEMTPPPSAPSDNTPVTGVVLPAPVAPAAPAMPEMPGAPVAAAPLLSLTETPGGSAPAAPPAPVAQDGPLLPPPLLPQSFAATDLTGPGQQQLFDLRRTQDELLKQATVAGNRAKQVAANIPRADEENVPAYNAEMERAQNQAITAAGKANEAESKAKMLEQGLAVVQKRQAALATLAPLDAVLPGPDRAELARLAADPAGGGLADQYIADMQAYAKVRNEKALDYKSNGLRSAQQVARAGAALLSEDGRKDELAWRKYTMAKALVDEAKAKDPVTLSDADKKDMDAQRKEMVSNQAQAALYDTRVKTLNQAILADTAPDPTPIVTPADGMPIAVAPSAAPVSATPTGIDLRGDSREREAEQASQMMANEFWQQGKSQAAKLANLGNATDEELKAIAGRALGKGQTRGLDSLLGLSQTDDVTEALAARIASDFTPPPGGNDRATTGRSGPVPVSDFLQAAAAEILAQRMAGRPGAPSKVSDADRAKAMSVPIKR